MKPRSKGSLTAAPPESLATEIDAVAAATGTTTTTEEEKEEERDESSHAMPTDRLHSSSDEMNTTTTTTTSTKTASGSKVSQFPYHRPQHSPEGEEEEEGMASSTEAPENSDSTHTVRRSGRSDPGSSCHQDIVPFAYSTSGDDEDDDEGDYGPHEHSSRSLSLLVRGGADVQGKDDEDSVEEDETNLRSLYPRHLLSGSGRSTGAGSSRSGGGFNPDDSTASLNGSSSLLDESVNFPDGTWESQTTIWNFAMEHRIFLKAILELLSERDKVATEVGMNDPNILKSGPLKKASHLMRGIWKVKYVEIRRGMFSYYEDQGGGSAETLLRKNIPLEANACQCRPVRLHQKAWNITPRGAIFELAISGKPKRLWMANSREERQTWIQAIHDAMVGGSVTRGGNPSSTKKLSSVNSRSPYKDDLKKYQKAQGVMRTARAKEEYVGALRVLRRHTLNVPVKWIIKQAEQDNKGGTGGTGDVKGAFHEEDVEFSVEQLFKDLLRDTLKINGEVYHGDSGHAPERITGALARRIMLYGRSSLNNEEETERGGSTIGHVSKFDMSESQALSYARDILLSGNRTRSGGDSYFCVDTLCNNPALIVVVPSSSEAEPLSITVSRDDDDDTGSTTDSYSRSGWLRTRRRTRKSWMKLYFVLSEGTLSYYEQALPRPHGMQGQMLLSEATITVTREEPRSDSNNNNNNNSSNFVLTIVTKDKSRERQILFESEERLLVWLYALECTAKAKGGETPASLMAVMRGVFRKSGVSVKLIDDKTANDDNGATSPKAEGASLAEASLREHVGNLGLDFNALEHRLADYASQTSATVKVSIQALTSYKICTLDPQGDDNEDTWAAVDATFLQDFRVSGGPNGRIMRGEEMVRVDVSHCCTLHSSRSLTPPSLADAAISDPSPSNRRIRKLFRTFSDDSARRDG